MDGRSPVAVTVEKRADDPAVQDPGESGVVKFGHPVAHEAVPLGKAPDVETLRIGGTAAVADVVGGVTFLDAGFAGHVRDAITLGPSGRVAGPEQGRRRWSCPLLHWKEVIARE